MWAALLGGLSALLLIPAGVAIGIYVPLIITDTAYQLYNTLGMSNFARELFGSTNGIGVNWSSPFSQVLLWSLIIGVIAMGVSVLFNAAANRTNTGIKHQLGLSRICFGIFSIILVPILFMFTTTITALIFQAISGNTSASMITGEENLAYQNVLSGFSSKIFSILGINTFNLNGQMVNWNDSLNLLLLKVQDILSYAKDKGLDDLVSNCNKIIQDINSAITNCNGSYISTQINELIEISRNMTIGQRLNDISALQAAYENLTGSQAAFTQLMKDVNSLSDFGKIFAEGSDAQKAYIWIFGDLSSSDQTLQGWINYVYYKGLISHTSLDSLQFSIGNVFANQKGIVVISEQVNFICAIDQLISGCNSSSQPDLNHYWTAGLDPAIPQYSIWIGINGFCERANATPSFTLAGMLNAWILGKSGVISNYNILNLYFSGYNAFFTGHMERAVIGMLASNIMMATMLSFAWYMVGRIVELIFLWFSSMINAFKADPEGTQFKLVISAIIKKTLSIVFIQFAFTVINILINIGFMQALLNNAQSADTMWFKASDAAIMLGTTMLFGGAYFAGNALCSYVLGEAGQLRSIGDQMNNLQANGRQQYGHGTKNALSKGASSIGGIGKEGLETRGDYQVFKAQGGSGMKDFMKFRRTDGKLGVPTKAGKE